MGGCKFPSPSCAFPQNTSSGPKPVFKQSPSVGTCLQPGQFPEFSRCCGSDGDTDSDESTGV